MDARKIAIFAWYKQNALYLPVFFGNSEQESILQTKSLQNAFKRI